MESQSPSAHTVKAGRIPLIDVARGVALVAMTVYHFTWDLEFFGWLDGGTVSQTGWVLFARSIAFSFLFLVGVSLALAHSGGIRWRGFLIRMAQVTAAAVAISVATYIMDPRTFIFFGILHAIALFSLLGLAFVRLPWFWSAIAAGVVTLLWYAIAHPTFEVWPLLWVGLAETPPTSNDYVPLFPWFAATLAGIAVGKLGIGRFWHRLADIRLPRPAERPLTFIGQHSLIYYLLHQPVMMAGLWMFTSFIAQPDPTVGFLNLCQRQCQATADAAFCTPYCGCVADDMKRDGIFLAFNKGTIRLEDSTEAQDIIRQCAAAPSR